MLGHCATEGYEMVLVFATGVSPVWKCLVLVTSTEARLTDQGMILGKGELSWKGPE